MDFRLLGPLEVVANGRRLPLRPGKQRLLLCYLLLHPNEPVPADRLIDALWGEHPPETATAALQNQVAALRSLLGRDVVETRPGAYLLRVGAEERDVDVLERLRAEAARAEDPAARARLLREALELWRGPALVEATYEPFAQPELTRLEELRTLLVEARVDADLACGLAGELVPELEALTAAQPLRERPRGQLMLALYRAGRQADALQVYQETRRILVDQLGIEPSPSLQRLHRQLLVQDPDLEAPPAPRGLPGPPREVRKTVTVAFVRAVEEPGGGPERDPETVREWRRSVANAVRAVFERHGASVEELAAGTALAVFGVPVVHEDDPVRAAHAALEVKDVVERLGGETGRRLCVSVGIDAGEVVAGPEPGRVEGDVVARAQALERRAEPGEILVSAETGRSLEGIATFTRLVHGMRLEDAAAERSARRLDSPLVGREEEFLALETAFADAVALGACRVCRVVGAPGVGKSRLVDELVGTIGARARVLRARCRHYGAGIAFWPLRELVVEATAIEPDASSEWALARVAALVGDASAAETLGGLIGFCEPRGGGDPAGAVAAVLERSARDRPVVVVIDDLHEAEEAFLDLVEEAVARLGAPALVVGVARPELLELRPDWCPGALTLTIDALEDGDVARLVRNLLGRGELPPPARRAILETCGGNPLFVEEVLASWMDDGLVRRRGRQWVVEADLGSAAPPVSVQLLLASRLERLGDASRTALECASVIGEEFDASTLATLLSGVDVEQALGPPVAADLVRSLSGDRFRFRHALARDAAYRMIPKSRRADLHVAYADVLEASRADGGGGLEELASYHLDRAYVLQKEVGRDSEATEELALRAGRSLALAGERAGGRGDMGAAARLLSRMAELLPSGDATRLERLADLGVARRNIGDFAGARAAFAELETGGRILGDPGLEAQARLELAWLRTFVEPGVGIGDAAATAEIALAVFEETGDREREVRCLEILALAAWNRGEVASAEHLTRRALERLAGGRDAATSARMSRVLAAVLIDGPTPVVEAQRTGRMLRAAVAGDRLTEAWLDCCLGVLAAMAGSFDLGRRQLALGIQSLDELGSPLVVAFWRWRAAEVELLAGDTGTAADLARSALEAAEALGEQSQVTAPAIAMAEALLRQERDGEAESYAALAERTLWPDSRLEEVRWRSLRARLLARRGTFAAALAAAREAVALAEATDSLDLQGGAYLALADVLVRQGNAREAADAAEAARGAFAAKGDVAAAALVPAGLPIS